MVHLVEEDVPHTVIAGPPHLAATTATAVEVEEEGTAVADTIVEVMIVATATGTAEGMEEEDMEAEETNAIRHLVDGVAAHHLATAQPPLGETRGALVRSDRITCRRRAKGGENSFLQLPENAMPFPHSATSRPRPPSAHKTHANHPFNFPQNRLTMDRPICCDTCFSLRSFYNAFITYLFSKTIKTTFHGA